MFPNVSPVQTAAWKALNDQKLELSNSRISDLFQQDPDRFNRFSLSMNDILFDYSKNLVTDKSMQTLIQLAKECKLNDAIEAMFNGEPINRTENRAVLHTALRNLSGQPVMVNGQDVMPEIQRVQKQM